MRDAVAIRLILVIWIFITLGTCCNKLAPNRALGGTCVSEDSWLPERPGAQDAIFCSFDSTYQPDIQVQLLVSAAFLHKNQSVLVTTYSNIDDSGSRPLYWAPQSRRDRRAIVSADSVKHTSLVALPLSNNTSP